MFVFILFFCGTRASTVRTDGVGPSPQARDTPPNSPAVRELNLDLSLWQPIVVDRQFVSWLVKEPTEQVLQLPSPDASLAP